MRRKPSAPWEYTREDALEELKVRFLVPSAVICLRWGLPHGGWIGMRAKKSLCAWVGGAKERPFTPPLPLLVSK